MKREEVLEMLDRERLVVILRNMPSEYVLPLTEAMYEGGVRMLEVTFDQKKRISDEEVAENIARLVRHFDGRMAIGCGTCLNARQVELTKEAGGVFVISPDTNEEVIKKTRELEMVSIPGAVTPTEVMTASRAGADAVKLFPAGDLGASYVKAIKAPLSNVKLIATGGVSLDNLKDFEKAGVAGYGLGSNIVDMKMVEAGDYAGITALAKQYVSLIKG